MWKARAPAGTEVCSQECKMQAMPQNWTLPQGMLSPRKGPVKELILVQAPPQGEDDTHIDEEWSQAAQSTKW